MTRISEAPWTALQRWPRQRWLLALTALSAALFVVNLFAHGEETWLRLLDLVDGPLFGATAAWGVWLLYKSRRAARVAEVAARQAEERHQRLFEDAPVALFRARADGTILEANPALHELLGVSPCESLVGSSTLS